jgi:quinone-modifying oxidoreductase, subunit QmoC
MASVPIIAPAADFRDQLRGRGGETAGQCFQCATCSSVCELAPADAPFPRRQMLYVQWGLEDRLVGDPGPWLCHQCNDCNVRCPRDARPGDVMQAARSMAVQSFAFPRFMGRLVGNVRTSWPLLIGIPILFWVVLLAVTTGLAVPAANPALPFLDGRFHYEEFVPHALIYVTYIAISLWVLAAAVISGRRFWKRLGEGAQRHGSFLANLLPALGEIAAHSRFNKCTGGTTKRHYGHLLVMWGFVGAAVTSAILILYLYRQAPIFSWIPLPQPHDYPLPLDHWVKWLGNISALALVVGAVLLLVNRARSDDPQVGRTTAFDRFFLWLVVAVIFSGVLTEVLRFVAPPVTAVALYLLHLSLVMTLFVTFPYSKFAHILYRTLAMVHQRMAEGAPAAEDQPATVPAPAAGT